jgi:hypothetical protein
MPPVAVHAIIFLVFAALGIAFIELGVPVVGGICFLVA